MTTDSHALATTEVQHNPVEGYAHDRSGGLSNVILGMLLFITSEVMFFAGLFAAYFNARANAPQWPPINPETNEAFHLAILPFVGPATVLLILSSFTCQFAVWAIRRGDHVAFVRNIAVTFVIGVVFLLLQVLDYALLASEGITLSAGTFGTTYFTLTGFHGAHVFGGAIMLGVVLYRGIAGQFSAKHHDAVEAASLYWHFVDVVWILLFSLLYLLPGNAPHVTQ
jgi:cytochrome c oxidase subunit 3